MIRASLAIAALLLAFAASAPAHAGSGTNGSSLNGTGQNGIDPNGSGQNGIDPNGSGQNGIDPNGSGQNGVAISGLAIKHMKLVAVELAN